MTASSNTAARALSRSARSTRTAVFYAGSFSKTMLPTSRIGFVVAPPGLCAALRAAKYIADWHTSMPTQAALARLTDDGHLARHIRKMRAIYQQRHDTTTEAITGRLSRHPTPIPSAARLHLSAIARTPPPTRSQPWPSAP